MFKDKNIVTKISNGILIVIFFLSLWSSLSIVSNLIKGTVVEGYTISEYLYYAVQIFVYLILSGISLLILNKKVNLYKDEYPLSRQIFNLFLLLSTIGMIVTISSLIVEHFIYNKFSFYVLTSILVGYLPIFVLGFIYVNKGEILSINNSKRTNIINSMVLYLLMTYTLNIILIVLQLLFKLKNFNNIFRDLIISIVGLVIVFVAYKLMNKNKDLNQVVIKKETKPVVLKEVKKKKNKKHE